ncbi:PRD domain-containing protein [Listeria monocytogenes]|uniref:BglG family transcription antiterminator LicT n=1 Tax=Listeria monocytogenes TaxID=1639 RepID=UPI0011EAAD52|nr:PRD domain-containing protein [Listeria monocytogenes]EHD5881296.1 PRD domain-containing protein [Listeria monocytogenes]MCD2231050.1 PRD domain-containing protein [Listeria monocytogenes]TYV06850.1 PRD domain-containing protein [Listeria monocytogenes]TYW17963.1 PRD domain-containing protein [Listeria monocytogenes]
MIIKKVFNNNVVLVIENPTVEKILMGKGIGYQKFPGDPVDLTNVEKTFVLNDEATEGKLDAFFDEVPLEVIQLCGHLVKSGKQELGQHITDNLLIPLADHINFAITRVKEGIQIDYPLKWEIRHMYPEEVAFAESVIAWMKESANIDLPKEEVVPIAMHFVNARFGTAEVEQAFEMTTLVAKILDIINYHYLIQVDEDSLNYARLITHLRYFILRQMKKESDVVEEAILYDVVKSKYPKAFECALKVKKLLEETMGWTVNHDEVLYLALHIHRVTTREKTK